MGCVLVVFGLPFLAAGLAVIFFLTINPLLKSRQASSWEPVEAVVEKSQVRVSRDSDGTTYNIDFAFRYSFGGNEFVSDQYTFISVGRGNRRPFDEIVERHPVGSTVTAFVNPRSPDQAVVERGLQGASVWIGLFGLVFAGVGGGIITAGLYQFRQRRRKLANDENLTQTTPTGERFAEGTIPLPRSPDSDGKVHLCPETTPMAGFIGTLLFTLFWNGIVGVFVWQFITSMRSGEGTDWVMMLFLSPFIFIGVIMIGATLYQFMALFNPKLVLWISPGRARPGQTFTVGWNFNGSVARLESVHLSLEGLEKATYRQGTNTYTDEHLFHDHLIFETHDRMQIASGSAQVTLPMEAVHSFTAENNEIIWRFHVQGHIRRWPNLNCHYPFVILPPMPPQP